MRRNFIGLFALIALLAAGTIAARSESSAAPPVLSDEAEIATSIRDEFLGHFQQSTYKISELARVMPAEKFTWAPGEGVMQVGEVYMHLARYNFMYLDENLGIAPPNGFAYADIESIRDKDQAREIFEMSVQHVKDQVGSMTESKLTADTQLYGRTVDGWAVLVQLISHMNEHVGQSVAYARMNDITPPWSR